MFQVKTIEKTHLEKLSDVFAQPFKAERYQLAPVIMKVEEKPEEEVNTEDFKPVAKRPYVEEKRSTDQIAFVPATNMPAPTNNPAPLTKPTKVEPIDTKKLMLWAGIALVVIIVGIVAFKNLKK